MPSETLQFIRLLDEVTHAIDRLPNLIAAEAVQFSKDRFRQQNWIDNNTQPWKKRSENTWNKNKRKGRGILVDTGRLFRSVRKIAVTAEYVIIGTDVPYAKIHNTGGRYRVQQHVKPYTRKQRPGRSGRSAGEVQVRGFTRTLNINMPRRQFMGSSAYLNRRLEQLITIEIVNATKRAA